MTDEASSEVKNGNGLSQPFGRRRAQFEAHLPQANKIFSKLAKRVGEKDPEFIRTRRDHIKEVVAAEDQGEIDHLSGIYNRRGFEKRLNELARISIRKDKKMEEDNKEADKKTSNPPFVIVSIDLNGLKEVNDKNKSHAAGDEIIKKTAKILSTEPDTEHGSVRAGDIVGRLGGDEFMVVLVNTSIDGAKKYWERKSKLFKEEGIWVSAGAVEAEPRNLEDSIKMADEAMYEAKKVAKLDPTGRQNVLQLASLTSNIA